MASATPPNFSWVEPNKLAGMALPRMPAHYQYLLDNGIQHLVTLCERKPPYHDTCPGVTLHHIRIIDFCSPTMDQIKRFLAIVEEANAKGELAQELRKKHLEQRETAKRVPTAEACNLADSCKRRQCQGVAVHCLHGHGRTGTMLACYLVKNRKITGVDAIHEIRRLRHGSIETQDQEKTVVQFHHHIK
ncbi:dual specificity protein phosphatase 23b isoform X1 [Acipenser ruthenus]|uniref:dual specificity protein phosphatase 23b isoform X1 n=1 Tax=Acipenser ruthenus TaxID=7906 RepID=UPI0027420D18|nr:dual specificity protein phosphatase 23b isoform X1 [Acipenser ruthenus]XP_058881697.1 dual specificity protein phosphatase 23b isoform X1 [Acipenser ruthenus]XP_058881698.1 dual specificity protein phosphatase 23b isoform X1 [Acipenser ruthenus]